MYFGMFDPTVMLLIPAMIFSLYAQGKVKSAYSRYVQINNRRGLTGRQAARMILDANGLSHVPVEITSGTLTDHYDPKNDVMRLSAKCTTEHPLHRSVLRPMNRVMRYRMGLPYGFFRFRNAIAPVVSFVSVASWPLIADRTGDNLGRKQDNRQPDL